MPARADVVERQAELRQEGCARLAHVLSGAALVEERLLISGSVGERERDGLINLQSAPLCGRAAIRVVVVRRRQFGLRRCGLIRLRRGRRLLGGKARALTEQTKQHDERAN